MHFSQKRTLAIHSVFTSLTEDKPVISKSSSEPSGFILPTAKVAPIIAMIFTFKTCFRQKFWFPLKLRNQKSMMLPQSYVTPLYSASSRSCIESSNDWTSAAINLRYLFCGEIYCAVSAVLRSFTVVVVVVACVFLHFFCLIFLTLLCRPVKCGFRDTKNNYQCAFTVNYNRERFGTPWSRSGRVISLDQYPALATAVVNFTL